MKKGKETACKYCPYDGICQFDNVLEDNGYRLIHKMDSQEVVRRIAEERGEYDHA